MKLINPSVKILPQKPGLQGIYEQIEIAARTCYKSESVIKYDEQGNSITAKPFVEKIVNVYKHQSVAEHGTVYLAILHNPFSSIQDSTFRYRNNPYSKVVNPNPFEIGLVYVTTNYRVLIENNWLDDLQYLCEPTEYHEKRVTVRFITDIGVSRELNRHRANSISEQSTRYCNYSKDKFGNELSIAINEDISLEQIQDNIQMLEEMDIDKTVLQNICGLINEFNGMYFEAVDFWIFANLACEFSYMNLIRLGWKPEQARRILPLDLNTELVHTAFISDWRHFFELRTSENAHPDIRKLAIDLQEIFKNEHLLS